MRFAARIAAEPGWRVILSKDDGDISSLTIEEWGIVYSERGAKLVPLDPTTGEDITKRANFLRTVDPNEDFNFANYKSLAASKKVQAESKA